MMELPTIASTVRAGAGSLQGPRVAFVTNFCPHYRIKTFETLAEEYDVDFIFYSAGRDWYWDRRHGVRSGRFKHQYLPGIQIGRTRITPSLVLRLLAGRYDVYVKCINGKFALPVTWIVARLRRRPFILWTGIWTRIDTPTQRLLFPLTRWLYNHSDAIVVYGTHVKHYLESEGVDPERVFVAPHAVDNDAYRRPVTPQETNAVRTELAISTTAKVILFVGRLEEVKGLKYLLDAFASVRCDDAVLVVIGDGCLRDDLIRQAEDLGIRSKVRFHGYLSPENTLPYLATAEVLALPSISVPAGKELWGLVVNEAFNQGVPVIATDAVGASAGGLVTDGETGFVVPERETGPLAIALESLLNDTKLRARMSIECKLRVARWDNRRMTEGFANAIQSVLARA